MNLLNLQTIDTLGIRTILEQVSETVGSTYQIQRAETDRTSGPFPTMDGLKQLMDVVVRLDADRAKRPRLSPDEISGLGDYGFTLLDSLMEWADTLQLTDEARRLSVVFPALGLWIARHGGELRSLESLANTLAQFANSTLDAKELTTLQNIMSEIIDAVSPTIKQDLEKTNPGRPWRVLILNRGIVATRTHDTDLMVSAFDTLVRYFPEEAPGFFREGMQQMDALDYPEDVRDVMQRYFDEWAARPLH